MSRALMSRDLAPSLSKGARRRHVPHRSCRDGLGTRGARREGRATRPNGACPGTGRFFASPCFPCEFPSVAASPLGLARSGTAPCGWSRLTVALAWAIYQPQGCPPQKEALP